MSRAPGHPPSRRRRGPGRRAAAAVAVDESTSKLMANGKQEVFALLETLPRKPR